MIIRVYEAIETDKNCFRIKDELFSPGWGDSSVVPRPIPSFSMLHTEKQEGLICKVTCMMCPVER